MSRRNWVLIDTSVWVDLLRGTAAEALQHEVAALMRAGTAAWCGMVRLELWAGVRDARERKQLRHLDGALVDLSIDDSQWKAAVQVADRGRAAGISAPSSDLLIFACASAHKARILHNDHHFEALLGLNAT